MLTLQEAIKKAEQEIGGKVIWVGDYKDRWVLGFDFEEDTLSSIVWCCYKNTGEIGYFFPPDEPDVLKSTKEVPFSRIGLEADRD